MVLQICFDLRKMTYSEKAIRNRLFRINGSFVEQGLLIFILIRLYTEGNLVSQAALYTYTVAL